MKPIGPSRRQNTLITNHLDTAAAVAVTLANEEAKGDGAILMARNAVRRMNEAAARVVGNRPPEAVLTWSDMRLVVAAQLRVLVDMLDPPTPEEETPT